MQITIGILSLITALYATQSVPNLATPTTLAQSEELQMSEIVEAFPTFAPLDQPWTGKISITGSDTMATALSALADSFMSIYPKCTVVVRGGGSEDGIASFIAGECDFASVSRALSTEEKMRSNQPQRKNHPDHHCCRCCVCLCQQRQSIERDDFYTTEWCIFDHTFENKGSNFSMERNRSNFSTWR